jgi:hypothetical protein
VEPSYTTPALVELSVTPDGHLVGCSDGEGGLGQTVHTGSESDLRDNLRRLGIAAGLDEAEWIASGSRVGLRLGVALRRLSRAERV